MPCRLPACSTCDGQRAFGQRRSRPHLAHPDGSVRTFNLCLTVPQAPFNNILLCLAHFARLLVQPHHKATQTHLRSHIAYTSLSGTHTCRGFITLPSDLLILRPFSSLTRPCKYTVSKGTWPVRPRPIMIMRATQKNRMSWPVSSTWQRVCVRVCARERVKVGGRG